jgi:long-chain fatty acid transport protein
MRRIFVAATAGAAVWISVVAAQAGGFASRDQSTVGEGMSFAGEGTPGMGLSAMFWNPAAVTQAKGLGAEAHFSVTMPRSTNTTNPAGTSIGLELLNTCGATFCDQTGNIFDDRVFPAFYAAYRVNPDWYVGLSVTRPFGFSSKIPDNGSFAIGVGTGPGAATQEIATGAGVSSVDVNPIVGWRINDQVSVGIGPQFLWLRNTYDRDLFNLPAVTNFDSPVALRTNGFGAGVTAGLTWTPRPSTEIALGYRSQVKMNLSGTQFFTPNAALTASPATAPFSGATINVSGNITLPDQVSLGARQRVTDTVTLLGTAEWTHWGVLQNIVYGFNNGPAPGTLANLMNFSYRDSWFLSAGAEYRVRPNTTLRAGVGYETSPVQGTLGSVALPAAERTSLSVGLSQKLMDRLTFDFGYSYSWIADQQIVAGPGHPDQPKLLTLIPNLFNTWAGSASGHSQAVSFALRYAFVEPSAPLIVKAK